MLYRIMHNTWINQYRKRQRQVVEVSVENVDEHQLAAAAHSSIYLSSAEVAPLESLPDTEIQAALLSFPEASLAIAREIGETGRDWLRAGNARAHQTSTERKHPAREYRDREAMP